MLYLSYLLYYKPLKTGLANEIVNEIATLMLSYFMFVFTDFMPIAQNKLIAGEAFVYIFIANLVINAIIIYYHLFISFYVNLRRIYFTLKRRCLKNKLMIPIKRAKIYERHIK